MTERAVLFTGVGGQGVQICSKTLATAANDIAASLGNPLSAGFVLLGAFAALTGLVTVDATVGAMRQLVPRDRTEHLQANEAALRAGAAAVPDLAAPAWPVTAVAP